MSQLKPLSEAFAKEPQHRQIFKHQGNCVMGCGRARDIVCGRCQEPMCAKCAKAHETAHLRDKYIEKIARGEVQHGIPADEWAEAMALRAKWEAEDKEAEESEKNECEN